MDGSKFDKLARVLADGSDRRGFLKRIAAVAAGAAFVSVPGRTLAGLVVDPITCGEGYDECPKGYTCVIPLYEKKGECVCEAPNYVAYDGSCIPEGYCSTDDDCKEKHTVCGYPDVAPAAADDYYGTCVCADGYADYDGKCRVVDGCKTDDDCYADYPDYYYGDDGYYYDAYGDKIPHFTCNDYGVCEEVPYEDPDPDPDPDPKPDDCVKECVISKRKRAKGRKSSKGGKRKNFRKLCQKTCAAKRRK